MQACEEYFDFEMIEGKHFPIERQKFQKSKFGRQTREKFAGKRKKERERIEIDHHKGETITFKPSSIHEMMMVVKKEELAMRERNRELEGFGRETQRFGCESQGFGCESQKFGRESQGFGCESQRFGRESQGFGLETQGFGCELEGFGCESQGFGLESEQNKQRNILQMVCFTQEKETS